MRLVDLPLALDIFHSQTTADSGPRRYPKAIVCTAKCATARGFSLALSGRHAKTPPYKCARFVRQSWGGLSG